MDRIRPEVGVVTGVRRGNGVAFGATVGWGPAHARSAERLVIEVDEHGRDLGGPMIGGNVVATVERPAADAEAVVATLTGPVRVWAGLVTDAMVGLADRGLLDGSIRAACVWGGDPVAALHCDGRLELLPLEWPHDLTALSRVDRLVAVNTAVQVGLDGSCNVETVGGRVVAGIGGNADFAAAGARSLGGMSIMALKSTSRNGRSTIVPSVEHVSTRCDVDVVVTEQRIADLRDADDAERARRIIAVAAPEHRAALEATSRDSEQRSPTTRPLDDSRWSRAAS